MMPANLLFALTHMNVCAPFHRSKPTHTKGQKGGAHFCKNKTRYLAINRKTNNNHTPYHRKENTRLGGNRTEVKTRSSAGTKEHIEHTKPNITLNINP